MDLNELHRRFLERKAQKQESIEDNPTPVVDTDTTYTYVYRQEEREHDAATNYPDQDSSDTLSSSENEYVEEFKCMLEDGEIGDRERRSLDRLSSRLGISKSRAMQLEALVSQESLSENEQEYLNEYKEVLAEGEIRDRDRRALDRLAQRNGISSQRIQELERLVDTDYPPPVGKCWQQS